MNVQTKKTLGRGERLLRLPEVLHRVGLAKPTLYQKIAAGEFPRPVRIGPRAVAWPASVIDRWIAEKIAASAGSR